jgi:uncharacterized phiE125 gp8 family phage protein
MPYSLHTAATAEPVSLDDLKDHLRITGNDEDLYLSGIISAARSIVETRTRRQLFTATWLLKMDSFADCRHTDGWTIRLEKVPVASVTSIVYLDTGGTSTTLSSSLYTTDLFSEPPRITPAYSQTWPSTRNIVNAVTVQFVAGAAAAAVPVEAKHAIKLLCGLMYENREAALDINMVKLPMALDALLSSLSWGSYA